MRREVHPQQSLKQTMPDFLIDIGKVLLNFHFEPSLATLLPPEHPDPSAALSRLLARKDEFESGRISVEDYTTWALDALGSRASHEEFHHAWRNIFTSNEPMWNRVRQLHAAGHRLILFSNINGIHSPWVFEKFPELSLFHGAVLSHEVHSIKPEPAIYQYAIDTYGLDPAHTLYIDDLSANIATGRAMGFQTHQYDLNHHQAFEQWLKERLKACR